MSRDLDVQLPEHRLRSMIAGAFRYGVSSAPEITRSEESYAASEHHANRLVEEFIAGGHVRYALTSPTTATPEPDAPATPPCPFALPVRVEENYGAIEVVDANGVAIVGVFSFQAWQRAAYIAAAINAYGGTR